MLFLEHVQCSDKKTFETFKFSKRTKGRKTTEHVQMCHFKRTVEKLNGFFHFEKNYIHIQSVLIIVTSKFRSENIYIKIILFYEVNFAFI
jgi:hypothetical protein